MSKIVVYDAKGERVAERQLDRERIRIGRRADCDIRLDHLSVSGEHALITTIRNDSFVQDLGSTNGVRVNGKLVQNHHLQDGDEIGIAVFRLKFVFEPWVLADEAWAPTVTRTVKQTVLATAGRGDETLLEIGVGDSLGLGDPFVELKQVTTLGRSAGGGDTGGVGVLRLMGGPGAGKQLELTKPVLTLGKPGVQTAVIGRMAAGYFLTYVEGESYPRVNGVEVGATPHELKNHDIIELAGTRLEFFCRQV